MAHIYSQMSNKAKKTWIFDTPMEKIEMTINNVEDYFMRHDKRFFELAITVRNER